MRPLFALHFFFETLYYLNLGQRLELGEVMAWDGVWGLHGSSGLLA